MITILATLSLLLLHCALENLFLFVYLQNQYLGKGNIDLKSVCFFLLCFLFCFSLTFVFIVSLSFFNKDFLAYLSMSKDDNFSTLL